ncbi:MAG: hypothetical protein AB1563_03145 [Bacillota bacterium]
MTDEPTREPQSAVSKHVMRRLRELTTGTAPAFLREEMAMALRVGLRQLWREWTLGRYLRGELSRDEAVELVGIDWVELAARQHDAAKEDLKWGLEQ